MFHSPPPPPARCAALPRHNLRSPLLCCVDVAQVTYVANKFPSFINKFRIIYSQKYTYFIVVYSRISVHDLERWRFRLKALGYVSSEFSSWWWSEMTFPAGKQPLCCHIDCRCLLITIRIQVLNKNIDFILKFFFIQIRFKIRENVNNVINIVT